MLRMGAFPLSCVFLNTVPPLLIESTHAEETPCGFRGTQGSLRVMRSPIKFLYTQPMCLSCSRDLSTARKNLNSGDSTFVNIDTDRSYDTCSGALNGCEQFLVDDWLVYCMSQQPYCVFEMWHLKSDVSATLLHKLISQGIAHPGIASNNIRPLQYLRLFYLNDIHKA